MPFHRIPLAMFFSLGPDFWNRKVSAAQPMSLLSPAKLQYVFFPELALARCCFLRCCACVLSIHTHRRGVVVKGTQQYWASYIAKPSFAPVPARLLLLLLRNVPSKPTTPPHFPSHPFPPRLHAGAALYGRCVRVR